MQRGGANASFASSSSECPCKWGIVLMLLIGQSVLSIKTSFAHQLSIVSSQILFYNTKLETRCLVFGLFHDLKQTPRNDICNGKLFGVTYRPWSWNRAKRQYFPSIVSASFHRVTRLAQEFTFKKKFSAYVSTIALVTTILNCGVDQLNYPFFYYFCSNFGFHKVTHKTDLPTNISRQCLFTNRKTFAQTFVRSFGKVYSGVILSCGKTLSD